MPSQFAVRDDMMAPLPGATMSHLIAPSILSADFARLGDEISAVTTAGADWIHVDVMDGHYVPVITLGPSITQAVGRHTDLPLDVHLMIEKPERHLQAFADAGAASITVHWETCPHIHRTIGAIKAVGCKAGVSINPGTPISVLDVILPDVDLVLVMTVNPGWGGQSAIPSSIAKVGQLKAARDARGLDFLIEVDGGVKPENAGQFSDADVVVAGSAVFKKDDYEAAITRLREALKG